MELGRTAVVDDALDQPAVGVDHLVTILEDGGLDSLDDTGFVCFMQSLERVRNRIPLADHRIIADAERRKLPPALTQGTMVHTLMSTLRLSPGEASRRERAAAAVGDYRGFDPADIVAGEELLTRFAETFGPRQLRVLVEKVVDGIDPDGPLHNDRLNADRRHFHLGRPETSPGPGSSG